MLRIHQHPIEATSRNGPRLVTARQHLPRAKGQARARAQRPLESVGRLHGMRSVKRVRWEKGRKTGEGLQSGSCASCTCPIGGCLQQTHGDALG